MTDSPALKNGNTLTYHGDSVPKPLGFFAFPLTEAQTRWFCRHPVPVSPKVGAPVASQRCRILRSGSVSLPQAHEKHKILPKYFLPNRLPTRYNYLCPGYFLLAGFEVTTIGRIWGDHRGLDQYCRLRRWYFYSRTRAQICCHASWQLKSMLGAMLLIAE